MKKKEVRIGLSIAQKLADNVYESIEDTEKSLDFLEAFEKASKKIDEHIKKTAGENFDHLVFYERKQMEFSGLGLELEMENYLADKKVTFEEIKTLQEKLKNELDKLHETIMPKISKKMVSGILSGFEYRMIKEYIKG